MLLRRLVGEKIELEVVHGRDLWLVKADLNQFEQVIVNLVVNARDAMSEGGHITLRTRNVAAAECAAFNEKRAAAAEYVLVEVQDTGHGIPERSARQDLRALLHHQGSRQGHRPRPLHGLRHRQADRRLSCSARARRAPARPSASCCRATSPSATVEPVKKEAPKPTADLTGQGAILLVEDEEAVRAFASRALASRGYTVLEADSGVGRAARGRTGRRQDRPHRLRRHHAGNGWARRC